MSARLLVVLIVLSIVVVGCAGNTTPTANHPTAPAVTVSANPTNTTTPTATATATATTAPPSPTPSPTPFPTIAPPIATAAPAIGASAAARQIANLGVPVGNTYLVQTAATDAKRGIAYILSQGGDVNPEGGVLTMVNLLTGEIQHSLAISAAFDFTSTAALSADGARLYAIGHREGTASLLVLATGMGEAPLGEELGYLPDARALALDPADNALYVAGNDQVRCLDALTLKEELAAPADDLLQDPAVPFIAVNHRARRLYLSRPGGSAIAVYNVDTLSRLPDVTLGMSVLGLVAHPFSSQTYARAESYGGGQRLTKVAIIDQDQPVKFWDTEPGYQIGQVLVNPVTSDVLLLEDGFYQDVSNSRIRVITPDTGDARETMPLPYLNLTYARGYALLGNTLYRLDTTTIPINLSTAKTGDPIRLEIKPVSAALDRAGNRLLVLDSAGTIHILDPLSLREQATWPHVLNPGRESVLRSELTLADGRLYVPDYQAQATLVLNANSGQQVGIIGQAGQITADQQRDRLFLTNQGVYLVDPHTLEVTGSIPETVRQERMLVVPGAVRADYYEADDLLFVTMTNNSPGSSNSTWLQIYEGNTLARLHSPLATDKQFLSGLAIDSQAGRVWVASDFPSPDLALFALDGQLIARLQGLGGPLYLDAAQGRLYVSGWGGLVTVDTATQEVIAYRPLNLTPAPGQILLFAPELDTLYATSSNGGLLLALDPSTPVPSLTTPAETLPRRTVREIVSDVGLSESTGQGLLAVVQPRDYGPSSLYLGQQDQADGGEWTRLEGGLPQADQPNIVAASGQAGALFAFAGEDRSRYPWGLFRSTDGGHTWQSANRGLTDFGIRDMALSPDFDTDGAALLLAGDNSLYRTNDSGETWKLLNHMPGQRVALARSGNNTPAFLIVGWNPDDNRETLVYAPSSATGNTSSVQGDGLQVIGRLPKTAYAYAPGPLVLSPTFASDGIALLPMGQDGLFRSQDYGKTWQRTGPRPDPSYPYYTVLFSPNWAQDATVYMLIRPSFGDPNYQARLYRSTDAGRAWQEAQDTGAGITALAAADDGQLWIGDTQGRARRGAPQAFTWVPVVTSTPTATPPSSPVSPTVTPRPAPPQGLYRPEGAFADLWSQSKVFQAIGWAIDQQPHDTAAAFQPYEGGAMIWRQDTSQIDALYAGGTWEQFSDTWTSDQPEQDPGLVPPAGRLQPKRGFGKIWRDNPQVREQLGWALQEEQAQTATIQAFERGAIVRVANKTYVLTTTAEGRPTNWWQP